MLQSLIATSLATLALTAATSASAADTDEAFGDNHQLIISADRLMPLFAYESEKTSQTTNVAGMGPVTTSSTNTTTAISLVGSGSHATAYNIPRFAFDFTLGHLTLGGSAFVYSMLGSSTSVSEGSTSQSQDNAKITIWGFAPRVGYIITFNNLFSFWPRGGFSFSSAGESTPAAPMQQGTSSTNVTQWAIDLEPMFAFTPVTHAALTFGPVIDIPLAGSVSSTSNAGVTTSIDSTQFHFGVTAGLLIYL